jgi:hypothetical protein
MSAPMPDADDAIAKRLAETDAELHGLADRGLSPSEIKEAGARLLKERYELRRKLGSCGSPP